MRPKGSADRREYRRQWAIGLLDEGKSINEVARLVKASSSVPRCKQMKEKHGAAGLSVASPPDQKRLQQLLLAGPQAAGFDSALWTCRRVA